MNGEAAAHPMPTTTIRELHWRRVLRLAFTLWRLKAWAARTSEQQQQQQQQQQQMAVHPNGPAEAALAGTATAVGARRMLGACVEMVEEILTAQQPQPRGAGRPGGLLARSSGESVASSAGGSVASAPLVPLVEAGRARVLQKEVAILRAKLQVSECWVLCGVRRRHQGRACLET